MGNFLLHVIIPPLGKALMWLIARTIRWEWRDMDRLRRHASARKKVIYAFWHNRLILMPHVHWWIYRHTQDKRLAVLVSQSKDGQVISGIIERFGIRPVRGSTTRGGKAALREMVRALKRGWNGVFTPDGPKGPRYQVGPGVLVLAQMTGLPIVPICVDYSHKIVLKSWDRMIVPLPFSRAICMAADRITVDRDANANVLQEKQLELKQALDGLSHICTGAVGVDTQGKKALPSIPS